MDRFSGKVCNRRNCKTQDLFANSTSGNVPDGVVEGRNGGAVVVYGGNSGGGGGSVEMQEGSCGGAVVVSGEDGGRGGGVGGVEMQEGSRCRAVVVSGGDGGGGDSQSNVNNEVANRFVKPIIFRIDDRVMISLTEARSIVEIRNHRRLLEGELDHVRSLVKKIEAKEKLELTLVNNANNNHSIVLVPAHGNISCRYPRFTFTNDMTSCLSLGRPNLPTPFRPPRLLAIANYNPEVSGGFVERAKRIPKANNNKSSDSKGKPEAVRNAPITSLGPMVAADALKESRTGEMHTLASSTHVEGERQADNASSSSNDSGSASSDSDSDSSSSCESDAGPRM